MQKQKESTKWEKGDTVIINGKSGTIKVIDLIKRQVMVEHQDMPANEPYNRNYSMDDLPPYPTTPKTSEKPGGIPTFTVGHKRKSYGGTGPSLEVLEVLPNGKYKCEVTVTGGNKYIHTFDGKRVSTWGNAVTETKPASTSPGPDSLRIHETTPTPSPEAVQKALDQIKEERAKPTEKSHDLTQAAKAVIKKIESESSDKSPDTPPSKPDDKEETQEVEVITPKLMSETKYRREIKLEKFILHDSKGWHETEASAFLTKLVNDGWRESHIHYQPIGETLFVIWTLTKVEKVSA